MSEVEQVLFANVKYAVSAGVTSIVPVDHRNSVNLTNVLNADAEGLGHDLSYRVALGNPDQAENLIVETVEDGVLVSADFTNGFAQIDGVIANTTLPVFVTFCDEDTYIFTIELIDTNTLNLLADDIEVVVATGLM